MVLGDDRNDSRLGGKRIEPPHEHGGVRVEDGDGLHAAERGRGVSLMRALVDNVRFESRPQAGTIVHLVKTLELEENSPLLSLPPRRGGVPTA